MKLVGKSKKIKQTDSEGVKMKCRNISKKKRKKD